MLVWRYLETTPLSPVHGLAIRPEPRDARKAVLRGKIRVRCGATVAETGELPLRRPSEEADEWFLDPAWVEANSPAGDLEEETRRVQWRRTELKVTAWSAVLAAALGLLGIVAGLVTLAARWAVGPRRWVGRGAGFAIASCGVAFVLALGLSAWMRRSPLADFLCYLTGGGLLLGTLAWVSARRPRSRPLER